MAGSSGSSITGLGIDLDTAQSGLLVYQPAVVTQGGQVQMRTKDRCIFNYSLIHPSILLGYEKPPDDRPHDAVDG